METQPFYCNRLCSYVWIPTTAKRLLTWRWPFRIRSGQTRFKPFEQNYLPVVNASTSLQMPRLSFLCLFFIHLHNPCDTPINNSTVICISMPEIEDRYSDSIHGPVRNMWWMWLDEGRYCTWMWGQSTRSSRTHTNTHMSTWFFPTLLQSTALAHWPRHNSEGWENGDLTTPAVPGTNNGLRRYNPAPKDDQWLSFRLCLLQQCPPVGMKMSAYDFYPICHQIEISRKQSLD